MCIQGVSDEFYVNEHLTMQNKLIYKEARRLAKLKQYKYVWTKNGEIFARKEDTSGVIIVKDTEGLKNIK
ncbi:unnamed protein product [Acanthoscelides obtectus]|uniref:FP protein C-terminal domain-containing protein n=1 Tax=Acanthoscelides obtectus TaxID=200917 RepID=A0A9P0PK50_ACAOB|nr:unnamed protein product [Acanthoscelides obtectus]CAK1627378.1 hypothetical protein AOBTE_LOCUS4559 [Acanthoscelides obtectus]